MIISRKFTDLKAAKQEVCSLKDFPSSVGQGRREKYEGATGKSFANLSSWFGHTYPNRVQKWSYWDYAQMKHCPHLFCNNLSLWLFERAKTPAFLIRVSPGTNKLINGDSQAWKEAKTAAPQLSPDRVTFPADPGITRREWMPHVALMPSSCCAPALPLSSPLSPSTAALHGLLQVTALRGRGGRTHTRKAQDTPPPPPTQTWTPTRCPPSPPCPEKWDHPRWRDITGAGSPRRAAAAAGGGEGWGEGGGESQDPSPAKKHVTLPPF